MKYLLGVVLSGRQKDYCVPKFLEQCQSFFDEVDVLFVCDMRNYDVIRAAKESDVDVGAIHCPDLENKMWATEIVEVGKNVLGLLALDGGYDALIWQGIDCFYDSKADFYKLLKTGRQNNAQMVGALVAGRNKPEYPVCRVFRPNSKDQEELVSDVFTGHSPTPIPGYIGSDATIVKRWLLSQPVMDDYQPWHTRPNKDKPLGELGPEEWFMWSAINRYHSIPVCHTGIRPWHVHETGRAVRYPDQECQLSDLVFK